MTSVSIAQIAVGGGTAGLSFAAVFVAVRWFANFIAGRMDKREAQLDAGMKELIEGLKEQVSILADDCRELRGRVAAAETDLLECKKRHAESEAEVMRLKAQIQGYGEAREKAALIVAAEKAKEHRP